MNITQAYKCMAEIISITRRLRNTESKGDLCIFSSVPTMQMSSTIITFVFQNPAEKSRFQKQLEMNEERDSF